ncbi:MAG: class I SAM-dependent methyltransferase [Chthonomonadales bacterium]|nr:class I SAM-dependent methyltransferase [Chthonomonadales bacterium]
MPDTLLEDVRSLLGEIPLDFGGGCSVFKAYLMAWLIRKHGVTESVDIGVYRGRSLFPQALAHRATGGRVYGVDPWEAGEVMEHDNAELREQIRRFVETTDFGAIYRSVDDFRVSHGLADHCVLVRKTSQEAAEEFRGRGASFGLIHVDGNHDTRLVVQDVQLYLPLLREGGFMVLDDASWGSVQPALRLLEQSAQPLFALTDREKANDFAVFWKGGSRMDALGLRLALRRLPRA